MLTRILDQNIQNLIGWLCHITFTIQIPSTKISRFGINPDFGHVVYRSSGTVWIQIPDIQIPDSYVWYSDQMSGPSLKTRPLFKPPFKNPFFLLFRSPFSSRTIQLSRTFQTFEYRNSLVFRPSLSFDCYLRLRVFIRVFSSCVMSPSPAWLCSFWLSWVSLPSSAMRPARSG